MCFFQLDILKITTISNIEFEKYVVLGSPGLDGIFTMFRSNPKL